VNQLICTKAPVKKKKVSIVEVAKKAGVSIATVSRVLNGHSKVRPETNDHIAKIAKQMGFALSERRPGPKPGKPSRKKKAAFINFIDRYHVATDQPATFLALRRGVEEGGRANGCAIQVYFVDTREDLPEAVLKDTFSGFILQGRQPLPSVEKFLSKKPCCWVMNNPWTPNWGDHVMPDHREAGMMAAEYLVSHGCRHPLIVRLGLPDRVSALREEGFSYALGKKNIPARSLAADGPLSDEPAIYPEAVYVDEMIGKFKRNSCKADGIFFDSDQAMAALYPVLVREKIITPGKTRLIGCNNQQPYLRGIAPHPATMDIHFELIGRLGVSQLAWRMRNKDVPQRIRSLTSPTLIWLG
jgi:LacI family transcriptional regulator